MTTRVVLVDEEDRPIGTADKLEAHRQGLLHRAFSVFILDSEGRMLIQRRAEDKYHSGGLWSNACCSHPAPEEPVKVAAARRLGEEMGFECALSRAGTLLYRADVGGGLTEHELDHLLIGHWEGIPAPDPAEVMDWWWIEPGELRREMAAAPERFTYWFRVALEELDRRGALPLPTTPGA